MSRTIRKARNWLRCRLTTKQRKAKNSRHTPINCWVCN